MKEATADPFMQSDRRIARELNFSVWTLFFSSKNTVPYYVDRATVSTVTTRDPVCTCGNA